MRYWVSYLMWGDSTGDICRAVLTELQLKLWAAQGRITVLSYEPYFGG